MCKLQKSNQEQRKTLNSLAYTYLFDPDMVHGRSGKILVWEIRVSISRVMRRSKVCPRRWVGLLTCCFRSAEKKKVRKFWGVCVWIVLDVKVEITTKNELTGCKQSTPLRTLRILRKTFPLQSHFSWAVEADKLSQDENLVTRGDG